MTAQTAEAGAGTSLFLHVRGPARLSHEGRPLNLRRKALAILYYLAFEGATRRERLADLLWDGTNPLANLRVELNAISAALKSIGMEPLPHHMDPLEPPRGMQLELAGGNGSQSLMEGLDGLGPEYQEWLDWRRTRLQDSAVPAAGYEALIDSLAGCVRAPFLLVVEPQPVQDARGFVAALSERLKLPVVPANSGLPGIVHVSAPYPPMLVSQVMANEKAVWVIDRPYFGTDPLEILELRSRYPAHLMRYIRLPDLSWFALRSTDLGKLPFAEAARSFISACGHPGMLREQAELVDGLPLQLPQRFRAATELELRKLPDAARHALQRLSIHPGTISWSSLRRTVPEDVLDELTEQRWLLFSNDGWSFPSPFVREAVYRSLPVATRMSGHRRLAEEFSAAGDTVAAGIQLLLAGEPAPPDGFTAALAPWARAVFTRGEGLRAVRPQAFRTSRQEEFTDVSHVYGRGIERSGTRMAIARHLPDELATGAVIGLPGGRKAINVTGRALVENVFGVGHRGGAIPLSIHCEAGCAVILAPDVTPGQVDGTLLLPLPVEFSYWLVCSCRKLTIESRCEQCVIEFDARCFSEHDAGVERQAWSLEC